MPRIPQRIHISTADPFFTQRLRLFFAKVPEYSIKIEPHPDFSISYDGYLVSIEDFLTYRRSFSSITQPVLVWGPVEYLTNAFLWGASDFIKEPFSCEEFFCRISRISQQKVVLAKKTTMSLRQGNIWMNDQPLSLGGMEKAVLSVLFRYAGTVVARKRLYKEVWNHEDTSMRSLDTTIYTIRQSMKAILTNDLSPKDLLITIPRHGYMLAGYK